jgi:hypothetical protein
MATKRGARATEKLDVKRLQPRDSVEPDTSDTSLLHLICSTTPLDRTTTPPPFPFPVPSKLTTMPSFLSCMFSCACNASHTAGDASKSSPFSIAPTPIFNSWFGRIMRGRKRAKGNRTNHAATTRDECRPRPSETETETR